MNEEEARERVEKYIKKFEGKALDCIAIGTVLNLLEKKDKEIENYKTLLAQSTAKRVITSLKDSEKSKEDLEMLDAGWKIELEKKDEIIKNQSYTNKKMRKKLQGYRKLLKLKERQLKKKDKQIEQYQNMLATNDMLHVLECEKKDKIIDLMAEEFENLKLAYFKKEDGGEFMGKYRTYNKNDWKQYFKEKVENGR